MPGDGNCFFTAIASSMLQNPELWNTSLSLASVTVTPETTVNVLATALRQVYIAELTGERRSKYEEFFVQQDSSYDEEARKFLAQGFYNSDLGDTMPLATCT